MAIFRRTKTVLLHLVHCSGSAEQCTKCSNTVFVLLKMAIMMPETCETEVNNKDLIVASYWLSLSSHYVLPSSTKVTQLLKPEEHWFIV